MLVSNVLGCIWFTNRVMDEKFFLLGHKWVKSSIVWERETVNHTWNIGWNPAHARGAVLAKVFPLESNCMVKVSGTTGELETYNLKCLLPPNAYLQYIFLILWFWYAMLLLVNFVNLLIVVMMMANSAWVRSIYLTRAIGSRKVCSNILWGKIYSFIYSVCIFLNTENISFFQFVADSRSK